MQPVYFLVPRRIDTQQTIESLSVFVIFELSLRFCLTTGMCFAKIPQYHNQLTILTRKNPTILINIIHHCSHVYIF